MNVLLATVQVPFVRGGAEILAEELQSQLRSRGHRVDTVTMPFKWYPGETLLETMVSARMMDLQEVNGDKVDLLIGLKFPAYYAPHKNKVLWLLHQHRQAYDLWGTPYGDIDGWPDAERIRRTICVSDTRYLGETQARYTISQNVSDRLLKYNGLQSEPLYHPPSSHDRLLCKSWEPYIFYPSRISSMKRQSLLVEAAQYVKSDVAMVFAGTGNETEINALRDLVRKCGVESRVRFEGYISEERKIDLFARCTAVFFGAYDEDYGYVTLEAMFSGKPVLALSDSGGAMEFVLDGHNGYVVEPDPQAIAERIERLVADRALAERLGSHGLETVREKRVNWQHVIDVLLGYGHA